LTPLVGNYVTLHTRVGHHLHVHSVPAVLVRVIGSAVADPVAHGRGAAQQDVVGVGFA
jgi:hypothetical protein